MTCVRTEVYENYLLTAEECAKRLSHMYRTQLPEIQRICSNTGLRHSLCDDVLHVISEHDCWRICLHVGTGVPLLFHRSTHSPHGSKVPHYHLQKGAGASLIRILRYINEHDKYRTMRSAPPVFKNTKKGRKARKAYEENQRNKKIARTLMLIEELSAIDHQ